MPTPTVKTFGFRFGQDASPKKSPSFVPPSNEDAALVIETGPTGNLFQRYAYDIHGIINNEVDLIKKYREMSLSAEVESAVDEIINDVIVVDEMKSPVQLVIGEELKMSDEFKTKVQNEFKNVLRLLNFRENAYDIIRRWYVDGRLYYHVVIDETSQEGAREGIKELRYIDPRCIKKVQEVQTQKDKNNIDRIIETKDFYVFNRQGLEIREINANNQGTTVSADSIVFAHSNFLNEDCTTILSFLHKAIKPYNNLRAMEDALVVYRITRAPERRIFNIDIGDMPPAKAKQYIQDIMTSYRNKLIYNPSTGEVKDDRRHATIMEDFWFPKRGDRSSSVETLAGGLNLSEIADVEHFQKKLYQALNIPSTRLDPTTGFNMGRSAEISREEIKFSKFITRLRHRFNKLFNEILKRQLILKKITTPEDWETVKENIFYDYISDSHFAELKETEIMKERLDLVDQADQYVGKYLSEKFIRTKILRQSPLEQGIIDQENGKAAPESEDVTDEEGDTSGEEDMPDVGDNITEPEPEETEPTGGEGE